MIHALYTLKKEYAGKKIYIWNINWDSMLLFTRLALRKVDIQGFVTEEEEYVGEKCMNRPVINVKEIERDEGNMILIADEVPKDRIGVLSGYQTVYWSEALEINSRLRERGIIIYGVGYGADRLCETLGREGMEPELYCVTKRNDAAQYKGKSIIEASELDKYEDYAVVISVVTEKYSQEILEILSAFRGDIYAEHMTGILDGVLQQVNAMSIIDSAVKKHRKIYLYSKRNAVAELIEEALRVYGIKISGYVYDAEDEDQGIESIYNLAIEGVGGKQIIISEVLPEKLIEARDNVELAGFSLEKGNYTGFQLYMTSNDRLLGKIYAVSDPLVRVTFLYSQGTTGWKLYGREENSIRIVVLGGSTSSEAFHPENWISKLYYKLKKNNIRVAIYNGAVPADDIVDEILRLLRDGHYLRPHIVISMSGVNNLRYKQSANQFNEDRMLSLFKDSTYYSGISSDESIYTFWSRNVKLLQLVSEFYGARFFGFLQPINLTMDHKSLWEKRMYELEEHIAGANDFAKLANDDDSYINLMRIFEHQDGMYFDMCHYTDKAHEIIANKVYETVMPEIQALSLNMPDE